MDYEKLKKDMAKAALYAIKYRYADDGGTCNFDTPVIILKGVNQAKMKELFDEKYGCSKWDSGCYHIGYKLLCGQGNRRTQMAEAFAKSLLNDGWIAYVYYQMD